MFWTSNLCLFFIKENWICAMTRHHAKSNINILLTRNFPIDFGVRQWSHLFMISLHFCGLNRTIEPAVNLNVAWLGFVFVFDLVRSHTRCGCCPIVCWREEGGDVRLKFDVQGQGDGKILNEDGQGVWGLDN